MARKEMKPVSTAEHPIVFFDGSCVLCNRFVDWVLKRDHRKAFRFTPLQGETAANLLPPQSDDPATWAIALADEKGMHYQSDAALRIISRLGGPYRGVALLLWIPRIVRDRVYRLIASNRYRWFGRLEVCRIPTREERDQFLT